ncbi:interleukin-4 [Danio aesculapii]|uniref:interleukin-4 n=1 Tax=Danio aesculapii TaxID=1142201 RepID=UPI0024C02775|nr:interleukin-4 [Danio aesculapii]
MRTFLLLVLTLVPVTESRLKTEEILLMEIMQSVNGILNGKGEKMDLDQFIPDIYQKGHYSKKTLCQAGMALKGKIPSKSHLQRQLNAYAAYTGTRNCSVSASEECTMKEFLEKTKACCHYLYSAQRT